MNVAALYGVDIPPDTIEKLSALMPHAPPQEVPFLLAAITNLKAIGPLKRLGLFDQVANRTKPCIVNPPWVVSGPPLEPTAIKNVYQVHAREFNDCVQVLDGTFWTM